MFQIEMIPIKFPIAGLNAKLSLLDPRNHAQLDVSTNSNLASSIQRKSGLFEHTNTTRKGKRKRKRKKKIIGFYGSSKLPQKEKEKVKKVIFLGA